MRYAQNPPSKAQYQERDVDVRDPANERISSDRVRWLRSDTKHHSGFKNDRFACDRPSTAGRIYRAFARYVFAVLVGVGATLGWQSYGDDVMDLLRGRDPWLSELLPASTTKLPAPVTSAEVQQQLKPMALDIALVRRSVEQFAANLDQVDRKQDQMAQAITALQAAEQDISQRISAPPSPKAVHVPPPKPPQSAAQ
jgi:hypothetical protein